MTALSPRDGYRLWAPTFHDETAISFLENELVAALTPPLAGLSLLDAGCGTGRRLESAGAADAVGIDLCLEMLEAAEGGAAASRLLAGDARALPFRAAAFDVAWCRLMIGHVPDLAPAYRELARVTRPGGRVVVTDFHPDAFAAGHRRRFRDSAGDLHELAHVVHPIEAQIEAAARVGLASLRVQHGTIGPETYAYYARSGREAEYEQHCGLAVVLALSFGRDA